MGYHTMGTGAVWTPLDRNVIHFGSPIGSAYTEEEPEDEDR